MAIEKEEVVALTRGESQKISKYVYEALRGAKCIIYHIHTYSTLKRERNIEVTESQGSRIPNTYCP